MESALRDAADPGLKVIETLRYLPGEGTVRGADHAKRMLGTCAALDYPVDPAVLASIMGANYGTAPRRLRITADADGVFEVSSAPLLWPQPDRVRRVAVAAARLDASDPFLRIKTTRRDLYNRSFAGRAEGIDELIFLNRDGLLCEGTYTNVFLETADGEKVTPSLDCGLLPGVLRGSLVAAGTFREAAIDEGTLRAARSLWIGNSLRGLMPAEIV